MTDVVQYGSRKPNAIFSHAGVAGEYSGPRKLDPWLVLQGSSKAGLVMRPESGDEQATD